MTTRFNALHWQKTAADVDALSHQLRDGDLVFISVINPLYRHVARATASPATHIGIAFHDETRGWLIAESTVPFAKYTSLNRYLSRSYSRWVAVRRISQHLDVNQIQLLRDACDKRMGRFYDFGFNYDSPRLFCSKFFFDVYREAMNIEIGSLQSFEDLFKPDINQSLWFWKLWFFGEIPWSRRTVTPASQLNASLLTAVA